MQQADDGSDLRYRVEIGSFTYEVAGEEFAWPYALLNQATKRVNCRYTFRLSAHQGASAGHVGRLAIDDNQMRGSGYSIEATPDGLRSLAAKLVVMADQFEKALESNR